MFVDRRKLARKRLLTIGATVLGCLFVLLIVIIIVYSGNEPADSGTGDIDDGIDIVEAPPEVTPSPTPTYNPPTSTPSPTPMIPIASNNQDSIDNTEPDEPTQVPADSDNTADTTEEPSAPADEETEPVRTQDEENQDFALEACLAIYNAAQNWWYDLSETQGLSDDTVINSFIADFQLPGSSITTFDATAANIEIQGTFNDGKFVIDLVFADNGGTNYPKGINFVAWYSPANPYCATWSSSSAGTGDLDIQVDLWNGAAPRARY